MRTVIVDLPDPSFPVRGSYRDQLRYLLRFAVLAPSTHNTQPWRFRLRERGVDVLADDRRALSTIDRSGRQLVMSVGAALYNLRLALRRFGYVSRVTAFPEASAPDLIARLDLEAHATPSPLAVALFDAIPRRRTERRPFLARPVGYRLINAMTTLARLEGATLTRLHPRARAGLLEVITLADRAQLGDSRYRKELSRWLVPAGSGRKDGIPFARKEYGSVLPIGPWLIRAFDLGAGFAAKERALAEAAPALLVVSTPGDAREDWLAAGQALEGVLLRAVTFGLSASFLNQALELDALRPRVAELAGGGRPQLVLRMGYGPPPLAPVPRRAVTDVTIEG